MLQGKFAFKFYFRKLGAISCDFM